MGEMVCSAYRYNCHGTTTAWLLVSLTHATGHYIFVAGVEWSDSVAADWFVSALAICRAKIQAVPERLTFHQGRFERAWEGGDGSYFSSSRNTIYNFFSALRSGFLIMKADSATECGCRGHCNLRHIRCKSVVNYH
jgi:hypothetical protein